MNVKEEGERKFTESMMECRKGNDGKYACYSGDALILDKITAMFFSNLDPINTIAVLKTKEERAWNLGNDVDTISFGGGSITCSVSENDKDNNFIYCDAGGPDPEKIVVDGVEKWCLRDRFGKMSCTGAANLSEAKRILAPEPQSPVVPMTSPRKRRA
jgi:hypothetical protein